jgi:hypothetical protein
MLVIQFVARFGADPAEIQLAVWTNFEATLFEPVLFGHVPILLYKTKLAIVRDKHVKPETASCELKDVESFMDR